METKKFVKKIAALAGSAAMLGATVAGALAALPDLPSPFITDGVFDAYVGVGATANVADVISAIELGAAFAQSATSGGTGVVTFEKNVSAGLVNSTGDDGLAIKTGADAVSFTASSSGFDWLVNETVSYTNTSTSVTTLYQQNEMITAAPAGVTVKPTEYATVRFYSNAGVILNNTFNASIPTGTSGIQWLGENYELVSWGATNLILGQITENTLALDEELEVGTLGATVTATDIDSVLNEVYLVITDGDGDIIKEDWFARYASYSNTTLGIENIEVDSFHFSVVSAEGSVQLNIRTAGVTIQNGGSNYSYGDNWLTDFGNSSTGINWISLYTAKDFPTAGTSGSTMGVGVTESSPEDYFHIYNDGLWFESTGNEVTFLEVEEEINLDPEEAEFSFVDADGDYVFFNLDNQTIPAWDTGPSTYNESEDTIWLGQGPTEYLVRQWTHGQDDFLGDLDDWTRYNITTTGGILVLSNITKADVVNITNVWYRFDASVDNATAANELNITPTKFYANMSNVFVPEFGGSAYNLSYSITNERLNVIMPNEGIGSTYVEFGNNGKIGSTVETIGTELKYNKYGTSALLSGGTYSFAIPETKRTVKFSVGRKQPSIFTVSVGETDSKIADAKITAGGGSTINKIAPTFAKMDTELSTIDKPVILVGGPAVNTKVNSLGNATLTLDQWRNQTDGSYVMEDRAIIDLVDEAFDTYDALVVAGFEADGTRIACRLLARELLFGDTVLGDNWAGLSRIVLDTTGVAVTDYTDATVVT